MYGDEVSCLLSELIGGENLIVLFIVFEVLEGKDSWLGLGYFGLSLAW